MKERKQKKGISLFRRLIVPGITLVMTGIVLASSITVAWLASNMDLDSNGMKMQADVSSNLVIKKTTSEILAVNTADHPITTSDFAVTFTDSEGRSNMKCATHADSVTNSSGTTACPVKLKYVTNTDNVSPTTGEAISGNLEYEVVSSASDSSYYVDFVVYIAATEKAMTSQTLKASVSLLTPTTTPILDTHQAASVDVYCNGGYCGTLNVATSSTGTVNVVDNGTIPCNTAPSTDAQYLTVTLRCYFDGELEKTTGTTYINAATVKTTALTLGVHFYIAS